MQTAPDLVIRELDPAAEGAGADVAAVHMLLLMMGEEFAQAPVNADKVLKTIIAAAVARDSSTILLAVLDGRLVGTLCFTRSPYWYSDSEFLHDLWFYVIPHHRNGDVGTRLLDEAVAIAELAELPLVITRQTTRRSEAATGKKRIGSLLRFSPHGSVLAFNATEPS